MCSYLKNWLWWQKFVARGKWRFHKAAFLIWLDNIQKRGGK